jgi:hypothetical protein
MEEAILKFPAQDGHRFDGGAHSPICGEKQDIAERLPSEDKRTGSG